MTPAPPRLSASRFAVVLRRVRSEHGLTQAALGARAGLDATTVSKLELAQRTPSLETLMQLGWALGVDPAVWVTEVFAGWEPEA